MDRHKLLKRLSSTYHIFPKPFWILVIATFIDHFGSSFIMPFLALYITQKFNVGMTKVGIIYAIFAITSMLGNMIGGVLADRFGRRSITVFGLVSSAISMLALGFTESLQVVYLIAGIAGLFATTGEPARQAMVADLLPESQQAQGYGTIRVAINLTVVVGPAIGGLLASIGFIYLFIIDAITSILMAIVISLLLPETKPDTTEAKSSSGLVQDLWDYIAVLKDSMFMAFITISLLLSLIFVLITGPLPVFLRDVHNIHPQGFGLLLSLNATMVVLLQFWFTHKVSKYPPFIMLAIGSVFFGVGYTLFGVVSGYSMFIICIIIITIGEMITVPLTQFIIARFSPVAMRGRYMAIFSIGILLLPSAISPPLAGYIMDTFDQRWVWYGSGLLAAIAVIGYCWLHMKIGNRFRLIEQEDIPKQTILSSDK